MAVLIPDEREIILPGLKFFLILNQNVAGHIQDLCSHQQADWSYLIRYVSAHDC